jgi:PIN domain nuclease of toxin-antitoxin system
LLLDTHTFIWWIDGNSRLSQTARQALSETGNEVFFSVVTAWEMAVKAALGRLDVPDNLSFYIVEHVARSRFQTLPIELDHAVAVRDLPAHHCDPFDRLLIAQSLVERCVIVGQDRMFDRYAVERLW